MKKHLKQILILFFLIVILILPYFVFASSNPALDGLTDVGSDAGYAEAVPATLSTMTGKIVKAFLSLLGGIFIVLMLYGGYTWMTAAGDEAKVTKAGNIIRRAIIGLIITVGSYAIWHFIFYQFIV